MSWRRAVALLAIRVPLGSPGYRTGARLLKTLATFSALAALMAVPTMGILLVQALAAGGTGLSGAAWLGLQAALAVTALVSCHGAYLAWVDARTDAPACALRAAAWSVGWAGALLFFDALPQAVGFFPLGVRHLHPLLWLDDRGVTGAVFGALALAAAVWLLATLGPRRDEEFLARARWVPRFVEPRLAATQWRCSTCRIAYSVPASDGLCPTCRAAQGLDGPGRKNIQ